MRKLQSTAGYFSRLFYLAGPAACVVCGQHADSDYSICSDCEPALPAISESCQLCGIELRGRLSIDRCCANCLYKPPSFNFCRSAFPYASPINKLVTRFKFSARFEIGYSLSRILAREINSCYASTAKPEIVIPIPLHSRRQCARGFNQAREISKVVSRHCQIPMQDSVLIKVKNSLAQTAMTSARARKANLRGAFSLQRREKIKNVTHIALIDDVVTTMATIEAATDLLQDHAERRIDVWCLARASR